MREEFTFLSKDGKTNVYAVRRVPEGKARGVIQLTHGMVEYIGRYREFADFLEQAGFVVAGHDHLGHGHTGDPGGKAVYTTDRKDSGVESLGYFEESDPSGTLVSDMHTLRQIMQKQYPDLPYFMLGHSMGSYLLRQYLALHGEGLAGAIIMGTGYVPEKTTKAGLAVIKVLSAFHGSHYRSRFVQNLSYSKPYQQYDLTGKDCTRTWLSKNEENVKAYYKDPWCTYLFTLNGYRGLMESVQTTCRQENVDKIPKDLPVLFVSGQDDPVGDLGEGVRTVASMFQKAGIHDVTMKFYQNDRHEILNETDRENVRQDILFWMEARLPKEGGTNE